MIGRDQWIKWDAESPTNHCEGGTSEWPPESSSNNSECDTELFDLESLMEIQSGDNMVSDVNEVSDLTVNIDELRAELTPVGWLTIPPVIPPQHVNVPANYRPATSIYSPTSLDYSPSQNSVHVDSENEHGFTPPQNSDGPITTRASDIFELENTDSDQKIDGEADLVS